jgi:chromosome segregation ATPase
MDIETDDVYSFHSRKNQLQVALTKHLSECKKSSHFIYDCIEDLKKRYSSNNIALNELSQLKDNISHWMSHRDKLNVHDWIVNWQNYNLISDFSNKLLEKNSDEPTAYNNTTGKLEKQIEDLKKQIEYLQKEMYKMKNNILHLNKLLKNKNKIDDLQNQINELNEINKIYENLNL